MSQTSSSVEAWSLYLDVDSILHSFVKPSVLSVQHTYVVVLQLLSLIFQVYVKCCVLTEFALI